MSEEVDSPSVQPAKKPKLERVVITPAPRRTLGLSSVTIPSTTSKGASTNVRVIIFSFRFFIFVIKINFCAKIVKLFIHQFLYCV